MTAGRATPDQVRLLVDVAGLGEVDAVASLDTHSVRETWFTLRWTPPDWPSCRG